MQSENIRVNSEARDTSAYLEYLHDSIEKPSFIMQEYGVPSIRTGNYRQHNVLIRDARAAGGTFSLDKNGFALVEQKTEVCDFDSEQEITGRYYAEVIELVKANTGARWVDVLDHTIRHSDGIEGVRRIATHVHNDYTETSCPQKLRDHLGDAVANELLTRRVVQINVWRSINGPVKVAPLAVVDGSSLERDDLVTCDIVYPDRIGEIFAVRRNSAHRWYYFPEVDVDEVILFKGYDSEQDGRVRFTPHSAFLHPDSKTNDPPRISIEVRVIASF